MEYKDYQELWTAYDKEAKDGRYQDALKQLDVIKSQAMLDNNDEQLLKTWFMRMAAIRNTTEDEVLNQIQYVESQFDNLINQTSKSIGYSYLGELYNEYLNNNQYKLRQLTEVQTDLPKDIQEWGIEQLLDIITELYLKSVENHDDIEVDISSYNAIVENLQEDGYEFRKTVFDVLSSRAINHFNSTFIDRTQPLEEFVFDQEIAFGPSEKFVTYKFQDNDKNSKTYRIIKLYQLIESMHPLNSNTRLDNEIHRIEYANRSSITENKDDLYPKALERILSTNSGNKISLKALQLLLQHHVYKGQSFIAKGGEKNKHYIKATDLIKQYSNRFDDKKGREVLEGFSAQINQTSIQFVAEMVYPIDEAFPVHLSFRNSNRINTKIYKIEFEELLEIYTQNKPENYLKDSKLKNQQSFDLPSTADFAKHTTELVFDGLKSGSYILEVSDNDKKINSIQLFHVSNLAYTNVNNQFVHVADRNSGAPLSVEIEKYSFDWSGRKRSLNKAGIGESDQKGRYNLSAENKTYLLHLKKGKDQLFLNNNISRYRGNGNPNSRKLYTFTDRGIYRPGQRVYFKTIATIQESNNDPKVLSNKLINVILKDANYQNVEEISLTTNDFGSIHGSFDLPKNLLNGRFTLDIRMPEGNVYGNRQIRVEEYKRPTFQVTTDPITESYSLDQKVTLGGNATSFSGVPLNNVEVRYKVVRTQPYRYYYRYYNPAPDKMITSGTLKTDEKGAFSIPFIALSSKKNKNKDAVYNFAVSIDVIDVSGETRSTSSMVYAGKYAKEIIANTNLIYDNNQSSFQTIKLQNLNGEQQKGDIQIRISSLNTPKKWLKTKYWPIPELQILSKKDYNSKLPNYAYRNELDKTTWEVDQVIKEFSANVDSDYKNTMQSIASGYYKVELSHPEAAPVITYIEIIDDSKSFVGDIFHFTTDKSTYKNTDQIQANFQSAIGKLNISLDVIRQQVKNQRILKIADKAFTEDISLSKADLGGIKLFVSGIYNNRAFQKELMLQVPYTDQKLNLSWESFRSDLLPGAQEKWRFKLQNQKDQAIEAEVLTSMYDASLDEFVSNKWNPFNFNGFNKYLHISPVGFSSGYSRTINLERTTYIKPWTLDYPFIDTKIHNYDLVSVRGSRKLKKSSSRQTPMGNAPEMMEMEMDSDVSVEPPRSTGAPAAPEISNSSYLDESANGVEKNDSKVEAIPIRTNLNETVFFLPELKTNKEGETILEFTMNEALTEWNFQTLAHTKKAEFALDYKKVKTSKDLMVVPNGPRFFREGDEMTFPAKISNLTDKEIEAKVSIKFINTLNNEDITSSLLKGNKTNKIKIGAKSNSVAEWTISIPKNISSITYQVYAESGDHKDGEEKSAIVLPNRKLITQSQVITIPSNSEHKVDVIAFDQLKSSSAEASLFHISVTSNPSWLAVKSLPYLMEYQYKCSEQVFSRYFANQLGAFILQQNPKIEQVYKEWKDKDQLISALKKNEELKSAVLTQTPWVMDALSEEEQMERLANLFDLAKITEESEVDIRTLEERQNQGGFPWFPGGKPNWYITQHILEGLGQLDKMGVISANDPTLNKIINSGVKFIDQSFIEYNDIRKKIDVVSPIAIHYMYVRSFYPEIEKSTKLIKAIDRFEKLSHDTWLKLGLLNQAQLALYFNRNGNSEWSNKIIESLRQRSIFKDDLGRYWKEANGYMWHQSNIETQATLIAAFNEIDRKQDEIDELKMWLLNNKKTNSWKSTKATTHAVYSIVSTGSKWINNDDWVKTKVNGNTIDIPESSIELGTGEYEMKYVSTSINQNLRTIEFNNPNNHISWASTSLQFFEDLDKIKSYQETPLQLKRNYFKKIITNTGDKLVKIDPSTEVLPGDVITVRLSLIVDRPMEFIHLQDMRASGTEPKDVISRYKYSGGLGYYMETRDAATNFFIDYLPRGEYLLEYDQRANQSGKYSAGICTIQSMYAPEFGANSNGNKLIIQSK